MTSLYQRLVEAGVEVSNWQSDLYFPMTDQTEAIVKQAREDGAYAGRPQPFMNAVTKTLWYDAPFQFDPFWEKRRSR